MEKKNLISKWLNFNLSDKEQEAFDALDASDSYRKISEAAKQFAAPEFDVDESYQRLLAKKPQKTKQVRPLYRLMGGVAAAVILCLGMFYFLSPSQVSHIALNGQNTSFTLPDGSQVVLNDGSEITFTEDTWEDHRSLELTGEAYFDVASGKTFQVATKSGLIAVVGTKFNIKDRAQYFEVSCYEGKVAVTVAGKQLQLMAGQTVRVMAGAVKTMETGFGKPSWLDHKSIFKSMPYREVVDELERQYDVTITGELRNSQTLFTGSFYHENLDTALQAITIPLNLEYSVEGNNVVLKSGQ